MRKEFFVTKNEAEEEATWACEIVKVDGGYMAYESWDDYDMACNQE